MRNKTLKVFNKTLQKTHIWLNDLMTRMESDDERAAYRGLRAVLHALRDTLPTNEVAHFAAQLPMLIRGLYYEGWDPAVQPRRYHKLDHFLARIERELSEDDETDIIELVHSVFGIIGKQVSEGEITDVLLTLPPDLRSLWPDSCTVYLRNRSGENLM